MILLPACGDPVLYSRIGAQPSDGGGDLPQELADGPAGDTDGGAGGSGGNPGTGGAEVDGATDAGDAPDDTGDAMGAGGVIGTGGIGTDGGSGAGGMTGTGGVTGAGGVTGTGGVGMGGSSGTGGTPDLAQYNFETTAQGWATLGSWTGFARSTAQRFAGLASIGGTVTYTPGTGIATQELFVLPTAGTGPVANSVVTFHVFLPANAGPASAPVVGAVQPYLQDSAAPIPGFFPAYTAANLLTFGGWTTITFTLPATIVPPVTRIAVQILTSGARAFTGGIYVDSISWSPAQ